MVETEDFLDENILSGRDPGEVVNSKEAGQLERNMALRTGIGLRLDRLELPRVELLSALLVVHLKSFKLVARHRLDVVVLVVLHVLFQSLEGLARCEEITNRRIDGEVGRRDAENLVTQLHACEGVVHEEVAAHELVYEELSDESGRRVFCEYFFCGQFSITVPHRVAMVGFRRFLALGGVRSAIVTGGRDALFKCVSQMSALAEPRRRRHSGLETIDGAR